MQLFYILSNRRSFNDWPYRLKIHTDQHDARCMERDAHGHHITR